MNIVFVRHGQSLWNLENKFTGWVDIDLSERGKIEAKTAGATLVDNNFFPDICFTSYLKRSISTHPVNLFSKFQRLCPCLTNTIFIN